MTIEQTLLARANSVCELCGSNNHLNAFTVPPHEAQSADHSALLCEQCLQEITVVETLNTNHWRCLNDSMWSQVPAVQVLAWRMLNRLREHGWPQDLLDMMYLEDDVLAWAQVTGECNADEPEASASGHKDSNGAALAAGDTVVLIKDLVVKGANFTAKRGTAVRGISLVPDTPEHIEGRVNGQQIVILTQFVKKSK